ncbi:MAG: GFA family protein [bacterium]|nr:GFA family protein [bacterium]
MSDTTRLRTGGCLCGGVTYETPQLGPILQCHCENCRRLSGNFVAACRAETERLVIRDPEDSMGWHDLGYARYGFCRSCGSTLFYQASDKREITSVMVGTLNDASGLDLKEIWFADEAQPHNILDGGVPHHSDNAAGLS